MTDSRTAQAKRRRLGKGLQSIVGTQPVHIDTQQNTNNIPGPSSHNGQAAHVPADRIIEIGVDKIDAGRAQPRTRFDETALSTLADSIRAVGVLQPVVVRPAAGGRYELIAGERRLRASELAGRATIPAVVREMDDRTAAESALIENLQREDLNPIERALGIRGLIDRFGLTQQDVATRVGLDRSSVANLLRLIELEPEIRSLLETGELGLGHGKALLSFPPGPARVTVATRAAREGWSVRRLEGEAKSGGVAVSRPEKLSTDQADDDALVEVRDLERRLGEHLGTKVRVRAGRGGKGSLEIRFFGLDHFDDLMSRIGFADASDDAR